MKKKLIIFVLFLLCYQSFAKNFDLIVQYHSPSLFGLANGTNSISNWWNETDDKKEYHSDLEIRGIFAELGRFYFLDTFSIGHSFSSNDFIGLSISSGLGISYGHSNNINAMTGMNLIFYPIYDLPIYTNGKTSYWDYKIAYDLGYTFVFKKLSMNIYFRNIMLWFDSKFMDAIDFGAAIGIYIPLQF